MRHHSFMRWASAAMAALMFFQCTTPVAFATDDTILAESSIAVSSADSESVHVDSDAGYIPERPPENTSVDSSSNDAASSEPLTEDSSASSDLPEDASSNGSVESQPESDTDQISTSDETTDSELAESSSENTDESAKSLYQDGKILIYTCDQLAEIGSGQTLTDASGLAVTDENGAEITYALDAQYAIAEDIELTGDMLQWQMPEGFTGSITPLAESSDDLTLYDAQSDTIYLYNPYQMAVLHGENPDTEPVMDGDAQAATFGSGQLIYPNGESEPYLTYSSTHHYVLSKQFSSEVSAQPYSVTVTEGKADGRDFPGQVIKELNGKTYILIGNEQQLRKIGSGDTVYGAVYQAIHHNAQWTIDHDSSGNLIMLYGGDADLTKGQNGTDDYTLGKDGIHEADKKFSDKANNLLYVYTVGRCGVNQKTGEIDPNLDIDKAANQTYAANANYIIFRDIDLSTKEWTPLTFQGTMIGAKSANGEKIWNDDSSAINTSTKPTISNVSVMQTGKLNVGEQMGVGFFSTISSEVSENDIGLSKGLVQVSNLKFQNISVQTTTSETYYPETLVSTLTSTLGKLLGGLVSGLTFILTFGQVKVDLGKTLGDVLDARKKDPTALATGAIAGRVEGQVEFSGIEVAGATVKNVNNNTGGFVGYTVGVTQYDGLSHALGDLVKLLTNILNVIPGLGLGDLITILLGNAIPLGKLIPTGYINAQFADCSIDGLNISTSIEKDYAGGFVGQQSGSIIESCTVKNSSLSLQGKNFVGGFVGLARDSIIKGTLSGALDIETKLPKMNPESLLLNCTLDNTVINIQGENYAGGFAGGLANTAAVNCSAAASKSLTVHATKANAGGFAGIATLGWAANLGKDDKNNDLLGGVVDLVVKLLSSNPGAVSSLLSLAGVNPSYILGCTVDAPLTVNGTDYVGGVTGRGDGAYIAPSSADYLSKVSYWRNNIHPADKITEQNVSFTGVGSISGHNYVGGIAGSLGTASVAGLLNTTLGVASYLAFTVDSVTLNGGNDGFAVEGIERVGGGFGDAIGGSIKNVTIDRLASVNGKNMVGGFIGLSGPGELVGSDGGLTVNLLGLNYLLKLNNLLSLGQAVEVTITNANVNGIGDGFTVEATGVREDNSVRDYTASGFMARSNSTKAENAHVTNLKSVTAAKDGGYAAGFVAISKTGGLAEVGDDNSVRSLLEANGLVNAIGYLIPSYTNCTVSYVDGGSVTGDVAGGFAADFQSGTVNNQSRGDGNYYAVYNLDAVNGQSYAGGFAGRVYSGALADASKGISILGNVTGLNINLTDLLSVINAYVPYIQYAGVKSDNGFTVTANKLTEDTTVGSAGGFVGYASGAQISYSDVTKLKHTIVTPPDNLEDTSAPTYYDNTKSTYAVTGGRYAGGYVGDMDIGSAASVGGGLNILGNSIEVTGILDALSVVVTTIEHSDVTGGPGGYAVLATGDLDNSKGKVGMAGGYAGGIYGGHIQDSQAVNFSYIIGEIAAGGYVGEMQPGDVAKLLDDASVLSKVLNIDTVLASVLQSFVPSIRNSSTNCVPCGGAVRANAASDTTVQRGMAGGYVGHNMGGTIHGFDTSLWKKEYAENDTSKAYNGPMSLCKAERIRSVYGHEYAGGYTGLMEPADTAKVGGLKVLGGLISVNNILGALGVIYPVQTNTAVYGPLAGLDVDTWNSWVQYVGKYGGYGYELAKAGTVTSQEELETKLADYIYGYNVVAGRGQFDSQLYGGDAGGYVGCMNSGTLTNCMAYDAKQISAMHSAGGFAGQMKTGGAVELGTVNILGLKLNAGQLLNIAQLFVPAVRNSSVQGYQSGLTVQATGSPDNHCGYSGGYVGSAYGAQIQLNGANKLPTADQWKSTSKYAAPVASCNATNLRRVTGRIAVGGYVGLASAGSVAGVNTNASNGLLQGILDHLISAPGYLVEVLQATATTIHAATVSAADKEWGFVVDGAYKDGDIVKYAAYAGGFAGSLEASIVGESKETAGNQIKVQDLRSVDGGKYAGGFFGLADVAGVAQVSGKDPKGSEAKLLSGLIKLGNTSVLDAFRTYIYDSSVTGVQNGLTVQAHTSQAPEGNFTETRYTGCAGGFGGGMMDGSVKYSAVSNLANVEGLNYTGGFVGHLGKSGVADIDDVSVLDKLLLDGTVGALDLFGSHVDNCSVTGFGLGTVIKAQGGQQPIAGGFAGYADLAKINGCSTTALKQVTSGQIAGGFIGKTDMNYVVSTELQSKLLNGLFEIVNELLRILYIGDLQNLGFVNVNLGPILKLKILSEGDTLSVTLLGLKISVALNRNLGEGKSDLAIITIGDSVIELPCTRNGIDKDDIPNVKINLIKGNRTDIDGCSVTGISAGYDVFAGGARNDADGTDKEGYSGGFIGLNHEGQVKNSTMTLCDVVRGTENLVGPFTGVNDLKSVYSFNTIKSIEGNGNHYSIYRAFNEALKNVAKANKDVFGSAEKDTSTGTDYNRYEVLHLDKITEFSDLKDAKMEDAAAATTADLAAYASPAKAVLMLDTANTDNPDSTITEPADTADPCKKYVDLTISKIWKDFANIDGKRPNEIKVNIYQQEFKPDGTAGDKTLYKTITMTKDDVESGHASTWRTVLKNAPVLKYQKAADGTVTDTIKAYYVYSFEEETVPGYTLTDSTYDEKTYHATITNTHHPMLPDTGSTGDWLYVVVGVGILLLALSVPRKRKGRREAH